MSDEKVVASRPDAGTPQPLALNAAQAAKMLGISPRLLWTKTNLKEIPHVRLGRRILYPVDRLHEWLNRNTLGEKR